VLRGGYGLMYGPIYDDSISRANTVSFGDVRQFVSPDNGLTPAILLKDGVPLPAPEARGPGFGAVLPGERFAQPLFYNQDHRPLCASHQLQYSASMSSRHLFGMAICQPGAPVKRSAININVNPSELRGSQQNNAAPFPQYGDVSESNQWGNSSNHA